MRLYLWESISTFAQYTSKTKMQMLEYKAKHLNHMPTKKITDCYILVKYFDLKYPSIKKHHITLEF